MPDLFPAVDVQPHSLPGSELPCAYDDRFLRVEAQPRSLRETPYYIQCLLQPPDHVRGQGQIVRVPVGIELFLFSQMPQKHIEADYEEERRERAALLHPPRYRDGRGFVPSYHGLHRHLVQETLHKKYRPLREPYVPQQFANELVGDRIEGSRRVEAEDEHLFFL